MKYNVKLDANELYALADELNKYAETYEQKIKTFLEKLAERAIQVSSINEGDFSGYIVYSKEIESGTTVKMIAQDSHPLTSVWYVSPSPKAEMRHETISPLLMAEFGSGHYATPAKGKAAGLGGQGTLNVFGHAFDSNGWYWWTEDARLTSSDDVMVAAKNGRWKFHSKGVHPAQPLHKAAMACIEEVEGIAKEVFG